jgi:ATP-dependent exoDNAse (exonuclease V) beta subunit
MTFKFTKLDSLQFDIQSEDTKLGRYYDVGNGTKYPSVTTVLSAVKDTKFLDQWKKRIGEAQANKIVKMATNRGTLLHYEVEKYLLNESTSIRMQRMMPHVKELFLQMRPELDNHLGNIFCLEQSLFSHDLKIAGRVDCIAEWDGKISVIDFKTSTNEKKEEYIENYFLQCTAYTMMFEEITTIPIDQIVVLIATENSNIGKFVKDKNNYLPTLKSVINKYQTLPHI